MNGVAQQSECCRRCGGTLETKRKPAKFCDDQCRSLYNRYGSRQNWMRSCATCGHAFEVPRHYPNQQCCTRPCRDEYNRRRLSKVDKCPIDESPDIWDGRTKFNDLVQRSAYRLVCSLCADERYLRLSDAEVHAMRPQGCQRCGARLWLEHVPTSEAGTTQYRTARPDNLEGPSRTWVRRKAAVA